MNTIYQWQCPICGEIYQTARPLATNKFNYLCPTCYNEWSKNKTTAVYECAPVSKLLSEKRRLND